MNLDNLSNLIELFSYQVQKQNKKDIFLQWLNPNNQKTIKNLIIKQNINLKTKPLK